MSIVVSAHQPNALPGLSVVQKLGAADRIIWLDECLYTKGGFTNRNRLPDGSWLTFPIVRSTDGLPINRVCLSDHRRWRDRAVRSLNQQYGRSDLIDQVCEEIRRPYGLLVGLNLALLRLLLPAELPWHFQSHLDGGHAVNAVSEDRVELLPISERLAMMVAELGGDTYLSGPSGFRYLSEAPFLERGIEVRYWTHTGPNPCALSSLTDRLSRLAS